MCYSEKINWLNHFRSIWVYFDFLSKSIFARFLSQKSFITSGTEVLPLISSFLNLDLNFFFLGGSISLQCHIRESCLMEKSELTYEAKKNSRKASKWKKNLGAKFSTKNLKNCNGDEFSSEKQ